MFLQLPTVLLLAVKHANILQSEDGKVLETFFHQNQSSCRCLFSKGRRFFYDKRKKVSHV